MKAKKGTSHDDQGKRLKKIEGQVRGIMKMIDEQRYCIDILQQFKAIKSGLQIVEKNIIDQHLTHCVHEAISFKKQGQAQQMLTEIRQLLNSTVLK